MTQQVLVDVAGWAVVLVGFAVVRFASTAMPDPGVVHSPTRVGGPEARRLRR